MIYEVLYTKMFLKKLKKVPQEIIEEANKKIEKLKASEFHQQLKVHKLQGKYKDVWSMSVNYKIRIILQFEGKRIYLLNIGSHDLYKSN